MTEGAVANVVGECRSMVTLIEISHGMDSDRDRTNSNLRHLWRCAVGMCGVPAALQPSSVEMRLVSTSCKPKEGWIRMITRLRFGESKGLAI
jgi:hypothetical protein